MQDIINKLHFQVLTEDSYFVDPKEVELWNEALVLLVAHCESIGVTDDQLVKRLHRVDPKCLEIVEAKGGGEFSEQTENIKFALVQWNMTQSFLNIRRTDPSVSYMTWELMWEQFSNNELFGEYYLTYDSKFTREDFKMYVDYIQKKYGIHAGHWNYKDSLAAWLADD